MAFFRGAGCGGGVGGWGWATVDTLPVLKAGNNPLEVRCMKSSLHLIFYWEQIFHRKSFCGGFFLTFLDDLPYPSLL